MSTLLEALMDALIEEFDFPWKMEESCISFYPCFEKPGPFGIISIEENDHGWMLEVKFFFVTEGMNEIVLLDTAPCRASDLVQSLQAELTYGTLNLVCLDPNVKKDRGVTLRRATPLIQDDMDGDELDAETISRFGRELDFLLSEAITIFEDISTFGTGEIKSVEALQRWRAPHGHA